MSHSLPPKSEGVAASVETTQRTSLNVPANTRNEQPLFRIRELEVLQQLNRLMGESLDLETTLQAVLKALQQLVTYDRGEITLFDVSQNILVRRALLEREGLTVETETDVIYHLDEGLTGWLARQRRPLLIDDLQNNPSVAPKKKAVQPWLRAYLGVPLIARGELVGTLEIAASVPGQLTMHDVELVELLGGQAAIAIENARLYHIAQQRVDILERLHNMVRKVGRASDPDTFFAEVVQCVAELVAAQIVGILLYEPDKELLIAQSPFIGLPQEWLNNYVIPFRTGGDLERHWRNQFYWMVEDAQSSSRVEALGLLPLSVALDVHQVLLVPLESGEELIGFIQVANPQEGRRFIEEDARLLGMFASQISGTVRISKLVKQLASRTHHLTSLLSVASAIGKSLDTSTVLDEIVHAVSGALNSERTVIFVLDPVTNLLNLEAAIGVSERYWTLSQGVSVARGGRGHVVAVNEMYISDDIALEAGASNVAPLAAEEGFRAFADIPLRRGDIPVGLLSVQFVAPHHFNESEINLLQILAEQAAIAIENARLYTQTDVELQRRLVALESLQRVTREITSTVNLDHILQVVLREAIAFGAAEAGLIALMEIEKQVDVRASQGYDEDTLVQLSGLVESPAPGSILETFFQHPETSYIPDVWDLPKGKGSIIAARSVLLTPVFYEAQLAAVIMLQSSIIDAFSPAVLEFVEGLSAQTSVAIGNARLYQEQVARGELMHNRAEQMSLLLEVSRTMRSDRPLEDTLLDVAYAVQEGIGFDVVLISVLEGDSLRRVAGAGIPLTDLERMCRVRQPWSRVQALLRDEFRMGQCYYVPAEYAHLLSELDVFIPQREDVGREPGKWHKLDAFVVPLRGSRGDFVGFMSVDAPRDGLIPTPATAEVIEIFAAQIALAIENNHLVADLVRQVNTLQLFNELNRSITTKLDLPVVLNTVAQSVTNVLGYDYSTIFLGDQSGRHFVPLASSGYALELLTDVAFGIGNGLIGTVAKMGMPLVLEDTLANPQFVSGPVSIGSSVMVPLTVEGRVVGVLTADRKTAGDFSPTDVATLTALADQVSVAVENARLFDEVTRFSHQLEQRVAERTQELAEALENLRLQRDRTEVLYRIASELVSSLDFDRVLSQALSLIQRAVKASRGSVILLENDTGKLVYRAAIGHTEPIPPGGRVTPFSRREGVIGWVLSKREALVIADVRNDDRWISDGYDAHIRSMLAVPILSSGGEALGVISLQSPVIDVFDESEVRLVEAAAVQLGNALNNSELYRLIREQAERLGAMLRAQQIEAAKNQAILEGIADGVMVADANGRVILFNAAAERILTISRVQALGRFVDEIMGLYGSEAREWLSRIEKWRSAPDSYGSEEFLDRRLELDRQIVSIHISPVVAPSHEFLGVVSVFRDITSEVEADRAKSDFVSTVSHELRTPMTSIKGYVDLLLMGSAGVLTELQTNFLNTVKSNADRLTGLVNDLLDLSRIETGRVELHLEELRIETLIEQVIDMLRPKAEEKDLRLYAVFPPDLPMIFGDASRLNQILINLVGNAYKYTPSGGEIGVYVYVRNRMMQVAVADTGIGIGSENQKKIFERFYRVDDPAVMEVSGTGLGLSITVSLIQMHGGDIWLESELGRGSIFTFTIPLVEGESTGDLGELPVGFSQVPTTKILVVEEKPEISTVLERSLQVDGLRVIRASSGDDALRSARREIPHLIILDARLSDLNGFEVLQILKRELETMDIPVVMVAVSEDVERGLRLGAVAYLVKPLNTDRLLNVVQRILESHEGNALVVDGDQETLATLRKALQMHGLRMCVTTLGERAVRLASELHPMLIFMDTKLPDLDVRQVLVRLKRNPRTAGIPVVVMAQHNGNVLGEVENVPFGNGEEIARLLTKPLSVENVADEISRLAIIGA
ncbi:MAG: GAF domain-containing protein [Anaerolineae bacterium]|nr:GAF domain-containing protein [Anaerolineae bacterium]